MPAVTVENFATLAQLPEPDPTGLDRQIRSVTTAPSGMEGEGFPVHRAFAGVDLRDLDRSSIWTIWAMSSMPRGEPKGTSWHPHRGFETVTYIIDGTFEHQDSQAGTLGLIPAQHLPHGDVSGETDQN